MPRGGRRHSVGAAKSIPARTGRCTTREEASIRTVGWVSLGLFTMYLLNSYVLYIHGE
jgi:hypothetical protein